jgi:glyoxylase-like metal-dependent hydrolase (beta-lactamase superfamily II)
MLVSLLAVAMASCARHDLVVEHVVTGPGTNCYLLYDRTSREAALIDVAGPIEPLLTTIRSRELTVRYFLFTHGHFDHLIGLPHVRDSFPDALICLHQADFNDMPTQAEWVVENMDPEIVEWIRADPEASKLLEFDPSTFGVPDIFVSEGIELRLGSHSIEVIRSPGHSPGSVCYHVGDLLFSGDVLFRDSVGRVDVQNSSREDQIRSVLRLYELFPEHTRVYPGHGESTTIGREKYENAKVSVDAVTL